MRQLSRKLQRMMQHGRCALMRAWGKLRVDGRPADTAGRLCRRLACSTAGSAAAEFALLAVPILGLTFLVLNTGLVFLAQQSLQTATTQTARLIMTGQAQTQGLSGTQFQQQVCNNLGALFECTGVAVNVQTFSSFSAVTMMNPVQNGTYSKANMGFKPGAAGDIVVVQVFYQWPLWGTGLGYDFSNITGGNYLLIATAAFRNEPF
jgi:Flp pilus assembly protein TadG